ncbi:sigma-70 family RNA polymerase sigma factor [Fimbriiglobus ruber]|nr:sigma-70 family RNA polymerase sigma factor [Fimbriiglobus ruber]
MAMLPTSMIPSAAARSRSMMVAVVLGTALTAGGSKGAPTAPLKQANVTAPQDLTPEAVKDITKYCQVCWRNARLPMDRWDDCTQQVFARLLERVPQGQWTAMLNTEGDERREFFRAIDAVKKRTQRARRYVDLSPDHADDRNRAADHVRDQWETVDRAARDVLSPRQQRIVELAAGGWAVPEIAVELGTTPERVSDEKYKAIRKLRTHLGVDA